MPSDTIYELTLLFELLIYPGDVLYEQICTEKIKIKRYVYSYEKKIYEIICFLLFK